MKDLRAIWCEDQYRPLGQSERGLFLGRVKGERFQVYLREQSGRRLQLLQSVTLDNDWYWNSAEERLQNVPAVAVPARRQEHVVSGYTWNGERVSLIDDLSCDVEVRQETLSTGATCIWLIPKRATGWIVSLHGGPESTEGLEIRYGGLYRDLLRRNIGVAVLNYRGSSCGSHQMKESAWKRWRLSILEDLVALRNAGGTVGYTEEKTTLFGVSFGGALALTAQHSKEFGFRRVVLSSPLLDLTEQIERAGGEGANWFGERFGVEDLNDFSLTNLVNTTGEIHCFYGLHDEVLGNSVFERLRSLQSRWHLYPEHCEHSPTTYLEMKTRFSRVLALCTF